MTVFTIPFNCLLNTDACPDVQSSLDFEGLCRWVTADQVWSHKKLPKATGCRL